MCFRRSILAGLAASVLALSFGLAACGGDDDGGSTAGGTGTDAKYVQSICSALLDFNNALEDLGRENKTPSEKEAAELIVKPLDTYVKALKKASPPADAVEYHASVVTRTEAALKAIKADKNLDSLDDIQAAEGAPQAVRDRLRKVSDANATCKDADFSIR